MKNILCIISGVLLSLTADSVYANTSNPACKITDGIYRDVSGRGFELRFGPPPPKSVTTMATAIISHPKRGSIFEFEMTQSQGYGSTSLISRKDTSKSYRVNFFNSDLTQASMFRAKSLPTYLFVSDLGGDDYYLNQGSGSREIALGDVMWRFQRCK
jgi:hypothetical protein